MLCHMCIFAMVETWVNCPCWWMVINPLIGICIPMTRIPVRNGWPYHIYHDLTIEHMQLDVSHCLHMQSLQYTLQYMVQCTFIICVAWHAEDTFKTRCSSFSELWRVGCGLTLSDALDVGVHTFLGATLCRSPKGGPLLGEFLVTLRSTAKFWKSWQSSFPFWFSLVISCHLLILCHSCVLIFLASWLVDKLGWKSGSISNSYTWVLPYTCCYFTISSGEGGGVHVDTALLGTVYI